MGSKHVHLIYGTVIEKSHTTAKKGKKKSFNELDLYKKGNKVGVLKENSQSGSEKLGEQQWNSAENRCGSVKCKAETE